MLYPDEISVLDILNWPLAHFQIGFGISVATPTFQMRWSRLHGVGPRRLNLCWMRQDQSFAAQVELLLYDKAVRLWRLISENETKSSNFEQNKSTKSQKAAGVRIVREVQSKVSPMQLHSIAILVKNRDIFDTAVGIRDFWCHWAGTRHSEELTNCPDCSNFVDFPENLWH